MVLMDSAQTFVVTNNQDSGANSLRWAFEQSNSTSDQNAKSINKIVVRLRHHHTIELTTGSIPVSANVVLQVSKKTKYLRISSALSNDLDPPTLRDRIFTVTTVLFKIRGPVSFENAGNTNLLGGAIYSTGKQLILQGVRIQNCAASSGGAIYTTGSLLTHECRLIRCGALNQGGALWLGNGATLSKTSVDYNEVSLVADSSSGGAIYKDAGRLIIDNHSTVNFNKIAFSLEQIDGSHGGSGGGIVSMAGDIYIQNCSKVNCNRAWVAGGIQQGVGNITVTDSEINSNRSFTPADASGGGGIVIALGNVFVFNSSISHNKGNGMYSSGIVSIAGDVMVTDGSVMKNNVNAGPGGAIACNFQGSITVSGKSHIEHNTAASLGGGIVNFSLNLGMISVTGGSSVSHNTLTNKQNIRETIEAFLRVIFVQLDLVRKQAEFNGSPGGLTCIEALPQLQLLGTAVNDALNQLPLDLVVGDVVGDVVRDMVGDVVGDVVRDVIGGLVGGCGIAGLLTCPIVVSGESEINDNKYDNTEHRQSHSIGGGIAAFNNNVSLSDSIIAANGSSFGGGLYVHNGSATLSQATIVKNVATIKGGGILSHSQKMVILDSKVRDNCAPEFPQIYSEYPYVKL